MSADAGSAPVGYVPAGGAVMESSRGAQIGLPRDGSLRQTIGPMAGNARGTPKTRVIVGVHSGNGRKW